MVELDEGLKERIRSVSFIEWIQTDSVFQCQVVVVFLSEVNNVITVK